MNRKFIYLLPLVIVVVLTLGSPAMTSAAGKINSNVWNPVILKGPLVTCSGAPVIYDAANPQGRPNNEACYSLCDLVATAANVIYFGIGVVIWIIAPIFVLWAGILLLTSTGNPAKASEAKKMITGIVIGLVIVLCAYLLVYTFVNILGITGVFGFGGQECWVQKQP